LDRRADEIYRDLPAKDQELCKWLFLRLVQPGEGTEDTKRRASFGELVPAGSDAKSVESVISRLADARLITTWADPKDPGKTSVEVAHEALIRGWTQLRGWIDEDRAGLRLHLQLTAAAHEWEKQAGDAGYLYQGTPLAVAREWAEAHPQELNFGERKFLEASVQHELYLKASQLVEAIRVAETKDVPPLVKQLADRRLWEAKKQLLDPIIMNSDGDSKEHLHASLALLPEDDEQVEYLYHCLLKASPTELPVIRDALKQYQERLVERLWSVLEQPKDEGQYLQAASALALYDQSNPRWQNVGGKVAQAMVKVNVVYLRDWLDALHPARGELTAPLATIFRDKKHSETERSLAMNILADYASDQPTLLADLLMDSEENPFAALFDKLKTHQDLAVRPLEDELAKPSPSATEVDDQDVERKKDVLAERQARATVALIRLGKAEEVWPLMRHSADPRLRSFLVNWLRPLGADPRTLAAELDRLDPNSKPMPAQGQQVMDAILFHPQTSMRRALILALGGYNPDELSTDKREPLVEQLLEMYRNDPDAGIHGAAEWTLRRWKHDEKLAAIDVGVKQLKDRGNRRWYVNSEDQTLAVIEGPVEFSMGSPLSEPDRNSVETPHRQPINRRFAIATKEVTVEQYQRFLKENPKIARLEIDRYSPEPTGPMNGMTWYEAAAYCNWLSQQEGLATCYQPNDEGEFAEGMKIVPDALKQPGYRLPTEAEWEYACRAGAVTSRYYGRSVELLGKYAWYLQNSQDRAWPCGQLLPNELGLFDMLGNVYEWCQEQYYRYPEGEGNTTANDMNILLSINEKNPRLLRGGTFSNPPAVVRSALRNWRAPASRISDLGFRPSRTYH
ncbi:MAG: formylglycine-generating enzyme family protein, partial [Isosphaeraceae bacterium]